MSDANENEFVLTIPSFVPPDGMEIPDDAIPLAIPPLELSDEAWPYFVERYAETITWLAKVAVLRAIEDPTKPLEFTVGQLAGNVLRYSKEIMERRKVGLN